MISPPVLFFPYIQHENITVKYAVVQLDHLQEDLREWKHMYLAGRFHKPTLTLQHDALITSAANQNLRHAVRTALTLLPLQFSEFDLFYTIVALSYMGDPRTGVAEHPRKVYNIVEGQYEKLKELYSRIIDDLPIVNYTATDALQVIHSFQTVPR